VMSTKSLQKMSIYSNIGAVSEFALPFSLSRMTVIALGLVLTLYGWKKED